MYCIILQNRWLEHAESVKNEENKTALVEHAITHKHSFDFNNTKILDIENILKKRLFLEMIHIRKENSTLNYKTDIENLNAIYNNIIKSIIIKKFSVKKGTLPLRWVSRIID